MENTKLTPPNTDLEAIKEVVENNYDSHDHDTSTIMTSSMPWTVIGEYGIFTLSVRKYRMFNQRPMYGGMVSCGGMTIQPCQSVEEAVEWCYQEAMKQTLELDEEIAKAQKTYLDILEGE